MEVPALTLDELSKGIPSIALLKMNIEGAETAALRGASSTLQRTRTLPSPAMTSWLTKRVTSRTAPGKT